MPAPASVRFTSALPRPFPASGWRDRGGLDGPVEPCGLHDPVSTHSPSMLLSSDACCRDVSSARRFPPTKRTLLPLGPLTRAIRALPRPKSKPAFFCARLTVGMPSCIVSPPRIAAFVVVRPTVSDGSFHGERERSQRLYHPISRCASRARPSLRTHRSVTFTSRLCHSRGCHLRSRPLTVRDVPSPGVSAGTVGPALGPTHRIRIHSSDPLHVS